MAMCVFTIIVTAIHVVDSQNYVLQTERLNTDNAEALCLFNYDQHLASIHNESQFTEAINMRQSDNVWIGLRQYISNGNWTWLDNTIFDYGNDPLGSSPPWPSTNDQPSTGYPGEPCVEMHDFFNGYWNDAPCWDNNKYSLCNYPKPIYIINYPFNYQQSVSFNQSIGVIDVLDEIYVSFAITLHSWPMTLTNASILHIGNDKLNQRFPAISVDANGQRFYFDFSIVNNSNDSSYYSNSLMLNEWHHISLYQTQTYVNITVDNVIIAAQETGSHSIIKDRTIYIGNIWDETADATITNLTITTSNSHLPDSFNYLCAAETRWTVISGSWTMDSCEIRQTDNTVEGAIAWLGTLDPSSIDWTDYKIEVKLSLNSGSYAGILFRAQNVSPINNAGKQYVIGIIQHDGRIHFGYMMNNLWSGIWDDSIGVINYNEQYLIRIEAIGKEIDIYFNNEHKHHHTDIINYNFGSIALRTWNGEATFHSLRITFPSDGQLLTVNPTNSPTSNPSSNPTTYPTSNPTLDPTSLSHFPRHFFKQKMSSR